MVSQQEDRRSLLRREKAKGEGRGERSALVKRDASLSYFGEPTSGLTLSDDRGETGIKTRNKTHTERGRRGKSS